VWLAGVGIYITGTFAQSYGANLQRASLTQEEQRFANPADRREKSKQPRWVRGLICMVLAGFFMSFALFFATQTQLAPLQLFLFASNFIFAYLLNGEPFDWATDGTATAVVAVGVFMCLAAAPKETHNWDQGEMWDVIVSASWISFSVCAPCSIFGLLSLQKVLLAECETAGLVPGTSLSPWKSTALSMTYGALPGTMGGVNITLTKTTFSLIVGQWNHHNGIGGVFSSPLLYVVSGGLVVTFLLQTKLTIDGLEACSPIIVMSTFAVCEMSVATLGGLLCFHDYNQFELWSALLFGFGMLIALGGMIFMARMRYGVEVVVRERRLSEITVITNDEMEDYNAVSGFSEFPDGSSKVNSPALDAFVASNADVEERSDSEIKELTADHATDADKLIIIL